MNFKPPLKNLYAVRVSHFIVNTLSARRYLPHFIKVFFNRLVRTEGHLCDNSVQLVEEILFSLVIFIHCYNLLYCVNDYGIIFLCVKLRISMVHVFLKLETILRYQVIWLKILVKFFVCKGYYLILCINIRTKLRWLVLNDFNMMKKQYLIKTKEKGNFFFFGLINKILGAGVQRIMIIKKKLTLKYTPVLIALSVRE